MFFLLRCLFWLGLVFSHIAGLEGLNVAAFANQGAAGLGRAAMDAASQKCRAEPDKCLALATQAARLRQDAGDASRDTLNAGDRAPAWRLRTARAPD
jgi:hypothetical protein